jgi:hypothetical protein
MIPIDLNNGVIEANYADCIDCRLQGGTTQKPPFWP